jgi:hypothetical protein
MLQPHFIEFLIITLKKKGEQTYIYMYIYNYKITFSFELFFFFWGWEGYWGLNSRPTP